MQSIRSLKLWVKRNCLIIMNVDYIKSKIALFMDVDLSERRRTLELKIGSDGRVYFEGEHVWAYFLERAPSFSWGLQALMTRKSVAKKYSGPNADLMQKACQKSTMICFLEKISQTVGDKMLGKHETKLPYLKKRSPFTNILWVCTNLCTLGPYLPPYVSHRPEINCVLHLGLQISDACKLLNSREPQERESSSKPESAVKRWTTITEGCAGG